MKFAISVYSVFLTFVCGFKPPINLQTIPKNYYSHLTTSDTIEDTELVTAFVMFRHGDRTPDQEELELYPRQEYVLDTFFPFGPKALTNKGKQRGYIVGEYLRRRYDGLISKLYIPEEMVLWTTDYDRTKMTALTAMAGLYKPQAAQKWNPWLDWQPVPYKTKPYNDDELLYWYNCPRYLWLRDQTYMRPDVNERIAQHQEFFKFLSDKTQGQITNPEDVFFLSNLFQALKNVAQPMPKWVIDVSDAINLMTVLEYEVEFYSEELIRLASGVLMGEIRNETIKFVEGTVRNPKLKLYSVHENNVAGLMAAMGVFEPHQPPYGATFSVELRRTPRGDYAILAVYALDPMENGRLLPMKGCHGKLLCDFEIFLNITKDYAWTKADYTKQCLLKN